MVGPESQRKGKEVNSVILSYRQGARHEGMFALFPRQD